MSINKRIIAQPDRNCNKRALFDINPLVDDFSFSVRDGTASKKQEPRYKVPAGFYLFIYIADECHMSCTLNSYLECTLMLCTVSADSSRKNLTTLRNKLA